MCSTLNPLLSCSNSLLLSDMMWTYNDSMFFVIWRPARDEMWRLIHIAPIGPALHHFKGPACGICIDPKKANGETNERIYIVCLVLARLVGCTRMWESVAWAGFKCSSADVNARGYWKVPYIQTTATWGMNPIQHMPFCLAMKGS